MEPPNRSPFVQIRDLSLSLDGRPLVSHVSVDLRACDRLLVTAARSEALGSLAYALAGLVPSPWRTTVEATEWTRDWAQFEHHVLGARLTSARLQVPARTSLVPEDLDTWFIAGTGYDELTFFGWLEGRDRHLDATLFQLFDRRLLSRPIYNLSGGEKQRLALAETIVSAPDCLVLLNALGWLDREHRGAALDALMGLPVPIVFCDDHVDLLSAACNLRLHIAEDGQSVLSSGTVGAVSHARAGRTVPAEPRTRELAPAGSPSIVVARDLSFVHTGFEDVRVLDRTSFDVPCVRDILLVGANGTGKSTLAALVCGLEREIEGSLIVHDARVGSVEPDVLRERLGASAPQLLFQFVDDNLSRPRVRAYLEVGLGADRLADRADIVGWLGVLGIDLEAVVTGLDTFQKKMLVLARMGITDCALAFFDEPAWGLTAAERRLLYEFVDRFLDGMTRVWITHEPESVPYAPEAVIKIAGGQVRVQF